MIRILVVDDHPALQAGLWTVLRGEPGLVPVGTVSHPREALNETARTDPDVVLVDYQLPDEDGLMLCRRLKQLPEAPRVLIYSAYASPTLALPAIVAGADGTINKAAPADELLNAIRAVARGDKVLPATPQELLQSSSAKLDPEDLPILGMIIDDTPHAQIAETLRLTEAELAARIRAMIGRLKAEILAPRTAL